MLEAQPDLVEDPTEESVSTRWITTLAAKLFVVVLATLLIAETIRAFGYIDMQATVEVCKTAAQQLLTAIIAVAAADRYVGKRAKPQEP